MGEKCRFGPAHRQEPGTDVLCTSGCECEWQVASASRLDEAALATRNSQLDITRWYETRHYGTQHVTTVPPPSRLCRRMRPPCASRISLQRARPRPEPAGLVV